MSAAARLLIAVTLGTALAGPARAADQTGLGPWNGGAAAVAQNSKLVRSAMQEIEAALAAIKDPGLRAATEDALLNPDTCVRFRANLTPERKQQIVTTLVEQGLVDQNEAGRIPGGLVAGVFPGLRDDGTACPKLPMPYFAAPGSVFGGHHSEPGGLPIHVAVNLTSARNLADTYRKVYGTLDASGMPVVREEAGGTADTDLFIDEDYVVAAPIWHDWAKTFVFQWNADGSEYTEMNFGGNGKTDAWGAPGNTKTGGHHLMGVAEAIARNLPPAYVLTQASAHGAPTAGNEYSVVNWVRTAAILAGADPVERGYLIKDQTGRLRLAPMREQASVDVLASLPNQSYLLYEYVLHNLSDADYTFTGPAVVQSELLLRTVAPQFGYDPADSTRYNTEYRNKVLSHLGAERVLILYDTAGIGRVRQELDKLRAAGII